MHSDTTITTNSFHLPEILQQGISIAAKAKPHPQGWQGTTKTRATPPIKLWQNTELSQRLTELAASRVQVYDTAITALGQAANDAEIKQAAQTEAEVYAAELGN